MEGSRSEPGLNPFKVLSILPVCSFDSKHAVRKVQHIANHVS